MTSINFEVNRSKVCDLCTWMGINAILTYILFIVGLNSITEIQGLYGTKSKTATYLCQLCCPFTKIDGTVSIYDHLTGIKHMENYLVCKNNC